MAGIRRTLRAIWITFRRLLGAIARRNLHNLYKVAGWFFRFSKHGGKPLYPTSDLPWARNLEQNWKTIRAELDEVIKSIETLPNVYEDFPGQELLSKDDKWKTFKIIESGSKFEPNRPLCPQTAELLTQVPGIAHAFFSILRERKRIEPHCGPYRGLLNCHLALIVPDGPGECRMRVADQIVAWEEGRLVVFDETYEHEVWNDTDQVRVVLLMYVVRPLPAPLALLNQLVFMIAGRLARGQQTA